MVSKQSLKQKLNTPNLVQDKIFDPNIPSLESCIYRLFHIDLERLIANKSYLCKDPFTIQPSELDKMAFWEYEMFMDIINKRIKEENKKNEEDNKKYNNMNPSSLMRQAQSSIPKIGSNMTPQMPHF